MSNKQFKIALVLYTSGLDYDDRIRKQILSIKKLYPGVYFKIYAVDPQNREEEGITDYGVPYRIPYLKSRDKYPKATHTLLKALDFYRTIKNELRGYDAIWCADVETFLFVLFITGRSILWDHHELPESFIQKPYMRLFYKVLERKCRVVLHANKPRLDYMHSLGLVSNVDKHFVIRNYPEFNEIDNEYDDTYSAFEKWLGNGKCVYLQGIMGNARADVETIGAVLAIPDLKAVVVGKINEERKALIDKQYGKDTLAERIFFTGQIKQLKTPQYIRRCIMSLVFYKNTNMNNWFCEPNRLFQNLNNGNPVVVGKNPPMKELVEQYGVGVSADTDGCDQEKIVASIQQLLNNIETYKNNIAKNKGRWLWASQEEIIRKIMENLFR